MRIGFYTLRILGLWLAFAMGSVAATAGELKLRVQLVWGTDHGKPDNKDLKPLEAKARESLRQFKWKNYWVVNQKDAIISGKKVQRLELSAKCGVDFKELGDGELEVCLINLKKGMPVVTVKHSVAALKKGEFCILAGEDKEVWDDAWFVIISAEP